VSLDSPAAVRDALAGERYLADRGLSTAVYLATSLEQPLLLEGEAGVGKTEVAKALAGATGARLIRLQCHEGIDLHHALYDWDYPRQLLHLRAEGAEADEQLYSERFLLRRPLLEALQASEPVVLLIDEIDRADDEFEAFLLELLSDFQVSIPELGTVTAERRPLVVITSNRTRELHDALKRRCLYHWIDYPSAAREAEIVRRRVPAAPPELAGDVAAAVRRLRTDDIQKQPGIAEAIDWVAALELLGIARLDAAAAQRTLGAVLKYREDQELVRERGLERLVTGDG
jgi:MoxR-like ATPase